MFSAAFTSALFVSPHDRQQKTAGNSNVWAIKTRPIDRSPGSKAVFVTQIDEKPAHSEIDAKL